MKRLVWVLALVATASCGGNSNETYAVRGTLRDVGGPAPGADTGTRGTVRALTRGGELVAAVTTQADGSFVLRVPKGTDVFKGGGPPGTVYADKYGDVCVGPTLRVPPAPTRDIVVACGVA